MSVDATEDPTVAEFTTFLTKYCKSAIVSQDSNKPLIKLNKTGKTTTLFSSHREQKTMFGQSERKSFACQVCKCQPGHLLIHCPQFNEKTPNERHQIIKDLKRCFSCFSTHKASECKNQKKCSVCGGKHYTLLHFPEAAEMVTSAHVTVAASETKGLGTSVLLATAAVEIQAANGGTFTVRALLDCTSQSSFITENCVKCLGLTREKSDISVQALSGTQVPAVRGSTNVTVRPVGGENPQFNVDVLILPRITGPVPSERVWINAWPHINGLKLADPDYAQALPVDILLGADIFPYLLLGDKLEGAVGQPIALSTVFGWVLMGKTSTAPKGQVSTMCVTTDAIDRTLQRFLEVEDVPTIQRNNPDDIMCENIYQSSVTRQLDGRYVVNLPFKQNPPLLGKSRERALTRLRQLENRFKGSSELHKEYNVAMQDYLDSGHMSRITTNPGTEENTYYIPHHAVLRPDSTTTKMRIVFDASAKTSSGHSLNDNLLCGRKLQQDLPAILLRFRLHPVVFTADIKQMFRQIRVTEMHRPYQRLLYRFSLNEPVEEYQMNTVMFGLKSSPYLAIRTLNQLVSDEAVDYPSVANKVLHDLYVDDVVTGAESEPAAIELRETLEKVFTRGHFELRKWSSNSRKLLEKIPFEHRQTQPVAFDNLNTDYTKILGLNWDPKIDSLSYKYQPNPVRLSKRAVLSEIARIYDPLGLLSPVTTDLKMLMKYLWLVKVGWDDSLPEEAATAWEKYHQELPILAKLQIKRLITYPNATYELHGFSDSSEAAYAAVVYIRVIPEKEPSYCHLVMGKSRIAPATKMSIPRLELCGAWLLVRLLSYVQSNLEALKFVSVTAWSDSTVTLAWIKSPTSRLKTFVANRVAKIQQLSNPKDWRHVPSELNPADCASRGLSPMDLAKHQLW